MKNKKLTYFLIAVVAALWGLIIYRVFAAVGSNNDDKAILSKPTKEAFNDYSVPKDTDHLLLNYRDPFGIAKVKDTVVKSELATKPRMPAPASVKPNMNWSFITYSGYIRNPVSKKLVALVSINGQNLTLSEGQTRNQVKLLKNMRDSIKISYEGKTKFIVIKSASL